MKKQKIIASLTVLGVVLGVALGVSSAFAQSLVHGLIPAGSCSLPAGRYMLVNMNSGHSLYVEINSMGKMFAQDPGKMNITAHAGSNIQPPPVAPSPAQTTTNTQTTQNPATTQQPAKGSIWSGILKQGVNSLLTPNQTPQ